MKSKINARPFCPFWIALNSCCCYSFIGAVSSVSHDKQYLSSSNDSTMEYGLEGHTYIHKSYIFYRQAAACQMKMFAKWPKRKKWHSMPSVSSSSSSLSSPPCPIKNNRKPHTHTRAPALIRGGQDWLLNLQSRFSTFLFFLSISKFSVKICIQNEWRYDSIIS